MLGPRGITQCGMKPTELAIQVLRPTKVFHFDDANACFVKNLKDDFLKHLFWLPTIFCHHVFDICKMTMEKLEASVQHLHRLQQANKAKYEAPWKIRLEKEAKQKVDAKSRRKATVKQKAEA